MLAPNCFGGALGSCTCAETRAPAAASTSKAMRPEAVGRVMDIRMRGRPPSGGPWGPAESRPPRESLILRRVRLLPRGEVLLILRVAQVVDVHPRVRHLVDG